MSFPSKFFWGVATSSYQIEGAATHQGGGRSVWDMFCKRPGVVHDGESGDIACDHVNHWQGDVQLMQELGVQAYRFSISWPRVLPAGVGAVHEPGLEFYDKLVDGLLAAGIDPYVTLFHWDFPYELYCRGGWLNRDSVEWFANFAQVVVDKLSDRVSHWMTLNEPQCFIGLGLQTAQHAPGDKLGRTEVLRAGHHALMAHGRGVQVIRSSAKTPPVIGYAPVGVAFIPETNSEADIEAARQATFDEATTDFWSNAWWMDPVFLGRYPQAALEALGDDAPPILDGDMETISQPLDFFGCNVYNGHTIRAGANGKMEKVPHPTGIGRTTYGWPVTPPCLYWAPRFYYERYKKPIVITENGLGNTDWVSSDGKVHDPQRIDFLQRHLQQFERAGKDGVDISGYFQWSLMDNFEWQEGYKTRFGIVYVDYQTQERIPKDSAHYYKGVIASNGASLGENPFSGK